MPTLWIDWQDPIPVGEISYLIEKYDSNHNRTWHILSNTPPRTNQSNKPTVVGSCGSYNNVSTTGKGIWVVIKTLKTGRVQLSQITDPDEINTYLEETGFPDISVEDCV